VNFPVFILSFKAGVYLRFRPHNKHPSLGSPRIVRMDYLFLAAFAHANLQPPSLPLRGLKHFVSLSLEKAFITAWMQPPAFFKQRAGRSQPRSQSLE